MTKSKKAKRAQKKVIDFKKPKLKVGRKLKKLNETLPEVKVRKILIKNQFAVKKIDRDLLAPLEQATMKQCYSSVKATERKELLVSIRNLIESCHYKLVLLNYLEIIEGICPLMVDLHYEVRLEVPKLLRSVLKRYVTATVNFTNSNVPIIAASTCRALANPNYCLDALLNIEVIIDLCPLLAVSSSRKLLNGMLMLCSKQISNISTSSTRSSPQNSSSKDCSSRQFSSLTLSSSSCLGHVRLCSRKSRLAVIKKLTSFINLLISHAGCLEYLQQKDNVLDDVQECSDTLLVYLFNILIENFVDSCYNNNSKSSSTVKKSSNRNVSFDATDQIVFDELCYELALSTLTCMETSLKLVTYLKDEGALVNDATVHKLLEVLSQYHPVTAFRKVKKAKFNESKEKDVSQTINMKMAKVLDNLRLYSRGTNLNDSYCSDVKHNNSTCRKFKNKKIT
ncbi:hypothetical protein HELRODRAFT_180151 [Helobdella robusta]|uniref:Pre-rRNA-processing protein Ipi1 N-terminal domain-containing protein n=1 Tax=Helobdella robusta TaxID=6412 RepID=T1FFJ0_HELRO|nr:hypothetical protein HELRODRAFT_180151 [Helobdella robusta]ESN94805.1 hypothetical protein HELRODRAFT_180151 [Helobdella robusta]